MLVNELTEGKMKDVATAMSDLEALGSARVLAYSGSQRLLLFAPGFQPITFHYAREPWKRVVFSVGRYVLADHRAGWKECMAAISSRGGAEVRLHGIRRVITSAWTTATLPGQKRHELVSH